MEAAIVRPHRWPFSTHYLGQPRLCLSTIIATDSRPLSALAHPPPPRLYIDSVKSLAGIEGVLSPSGNNIAFCVFRESEHRKPSVT